MNGVRKNIRVLQLVASHSVGGATLLAMLLARRLDPARFEVVLAVGGEAGPEGSLLEEARRQGINVEVLPALCPKPRPAKDRRALAQVGDLLRRLRPHVVHTHGSKTKHLLAWAAGSAPAAVRIAHIHGWEWHPAGSAATAWVYKMASRRAARAYDVLVATSAAIQREGLNEGVGKPDQYQIIRPGIDLEVFRPLEDEGMRAALRRELGLAADAYVVVSVMRLAPQKAPLDMVRAADIVLRRRQDIRFVIVGAGPLQKRVRQQVRSRGLEGAVRLTGARRDVARLLQAGDLFALASRWEAFGMAYLEAAAVGLPCIGTKVGGTAEAVEDGVTGLLVPPGRPRAIAEAILQLADNAPLARRMGRAGRHKAKQFGADKFVRQVEELYCRTLQRKGML